jgi:hypothetical protein
MSIHKYFIFFVVSVLSLKAGPIGNDGAVSIQPAATFPTGDSTNQMLGFGAFTNGFTLTDINTSCSFNAFFPVGSVVELNGGSLFLAEDLTFTPSLIMVNAGGIYGNQKSLKISTTTDTAWPRGGVGLYNPATFDAGFPVLTVSWSFDNQYIAYAGVSTAGGLTPIPQLGILQFTGNSLISEVTVPDPAGTRAIRDFIGATSIGPTLKAIRDRTRAASIGPTLSVRFHPFTYYLAVATTQTSSTAGGYGIQVWQYSPTGSTLNLISYNDLNLSDPTAAWHPSGNYLAVGENSTNGSISLYPFNTGTGALGTPSTTALPATATFVGTGCLDWESGGNYLVAGVTNNNNSELQLYYFNGTSLTFTLGVQVGSSANIDGLSCSPTGSFIAVALNAGSDRLQIFEHNSANGTLTNQVMVTENIQANSVNWRYDGIYLAYGQQIGNSESPFRVYTFNSTLPALTLDQQVSGTLNINEVSWSHNGTYIATGDSGSLVKVYKFQDPNNVLGQPFIFNNVNIILGSNIFFGSPVKFQGNCIINGQNNTLGCGTIGSIIVDSGCSLLCTNLTMTQVAGKITMVDQTSSITLSNVTWLLDNNHSFTQGYVNFDKSVYITTTSENNFNFVFQSTNPSLIKSFATLTMDNGLTFSYDVPIAYGNLFTMQDRTAVWYINEGVTLHSTVTGMQLLKGTLKVGGTCNIASEALVQSQGMQFGDGVNGNNDLTIELLAGSGLNITSGFLTYDNVNG